MEQMPRAQSQGGWEPMDEQRWDEEDMHVSSPH